MDPIMLLQLPNSEMFGTADVPQLVPSIQEGTCGTSVGKPFKKMSALTRSSKDKVPSESDPNAVVLQLDNDVQISYSVASENKEKKTRTRKTRKIPPTNKVPKKRGRPRKTTHVVQRPPVCLGNPKSNTCEDNIIETALSFALSSLSPVKLTDDLDGSLSLLQDGISSVQNSSSTVPIDETDLQNSELEHSDIQIENKRINTPNAENTSNQQNEIIDSSNKKIVPAESDLKPSTNSVSYISNRNHSPQLQALLSLSSCISPASGLLPRNAVSVYKSPTHISSKRGSQSTPRRKISHVRVLDFGTPRKNTSPNKSQKITKGLKFSPLTKQKKKVSATSVKGQAIMVAKKKLNSIAEKEPSKSLETSLMEKAEKINHEDKLVSQQRDLPENRYVGKLDEQMIQDGDDEENFILRIEDEDTCSSLIENSVENSNLRGTLQIPLESLHERREDSSLTSNQVLSNKCELQNICKEPDEIQAVHNLHETDIARNLLSSQSLICPGSLATPFKSDNSQQTPIVLEAPTPFFQTIKKTDLPDDDLNTPLLQFPGSALKTPLIKDYPQGPYSSSSAGTSYYQPSERSVTDSEEHSPSRLSTVYESSVMEELGNQSEDFEDHNDIHKEKESKILSMRSKKTNTTSPKLTRKEMGEVIEQEIEKQFSLGAALQKPCADGNSRHSDMYCNDEKVLPQQDNSMLSKERLSLTKKFPLKKYHSDSSADISEDENNDTPTRNLKRHNTCDTSSKLSGKEVDACQVKKKLHKDKLVAKDQRSNIDSFGDDEDDLLKKLEKRLEMGKNVVSRRRNKSTSKQNIISSVSEIDFTEIEGKNGSKKLGKENISCLKPFASGNVQVQTKVEGSVLKKYVSESSSDFEGENEKASKYLETFGSGVSSSDDSESESLNARGLALNVSRDAERSLSVDKKTKAGSSSILECRKDNENRSSEDFEFGTDCVKQQLPDNRKDVKQNLEKKGTEKLVSLSDSDQEIMNHTTRDHAKDLAKGASSDSLNLKKKKQIARDNRKSKNRILSSDDSLSENENGNESIVSVPTGEEVLNLVGDDTAVTFSSNVSNTRNGKQDLLKGRRKTRSEIISVESEGYVRNKGSISTRNKGDSHQLSQKGDMSSPKQTKVRRSQRSTRGKRSMTYSELQMSNLQKSLKKQPSKVKKGDLDESDISLEKDRKLPAKRSRKSLPAIEVQEVVIEAKVLQVPRNLNPDRKGVDVLLNPESPKERTYNLESNDVQLSEIDLQSGKEVVIPKDFVESQVDQHSDSEACVDQGTSKIESVQSKQLEKSQIDECTLVSPETKGKVISKQPSLKSASKIEQISVKESEKCNKVNKFKKDQSTEKVVTRKHRHKKSANVTEGIDEHLENLSSKGKEISSVHLDSQLYSSQSQTCSNTSVTKYDNAAKGIGRNEKEKVIVERNVSPINEVVKKSKGNGKDTVLKKDKVKKRKKKYERDIHKSENCVKVGKKIETSMKRTISGDGSEHPNGNGKAKHEDENVNIVPDLSKTGSPFSVWGKVAKSDPVRFSAEAHVEKNKCKSSDTDLFTNWSKCFHAYGVSPDVNVIDTDEESPRKQLLLSFQESITKPSSLSETSDRKDRPILSEGCARITPYLFSPERQGSSKKLHIDCVGEVHNITPRHRKRRRTDSDTSFGSESPSIIKRKRPAYRAEEAAVESGTILDKCTEVEVSLDTERINSGSGEPMNYAVSASPGSELITLHGLNKKNARVSEESLSFLDSSHVHEIEDQLRMLDGVYMEAATSAVLSDTGENSSSSGRITNKDVSVGQIESSLELKNDCLISFKCLPSTPEKQRTEICHSLVKEKKALVAFPSVSKDCLSPNIKKQLSFETEAGRNSSDESRNEGQRVLGLEDSQNLTLNSTKEKSDVRLSPREDVVPSTSRKSDLLISDHSLNTSEEGSNLSSASEKHSEKYTKGSDSNFTSSTLEEYDSSVGHQPSENPQLQAMHTDTEPVSHSITSPTKETLPSSKEPLGSLCDFINQDRDRKAGEEELVMKNENRGASRCGSLEDSEDGETCTLRYSDIIDIFSQNLTKRKNYGQTVRKSPRKMNEVIYVNSSACNEDSCPTKSSSSEIENGSKPEKHLKTSPRQASPPKKKPRRIQPIRIGEVSRNRRSTPSSSVSSVEERGEKDLIGNSKGKGNQSERSVCSWSSSSPGPLRISESPRGVDSPAANHDNVFVPSPCSSLPSIVSQLNQNVTGFANSEVRVDAGSSNINSCQDAVSDPIREMEIISDVVESETSQETNEDLGTGRQRKARQMSSELVTGISIEVTHSPNKPVTVYTNYQKEILRGPGLPSEESTSSSRTSMVCVPPTPGKHLVVPPAPSHTLSTMAVPSSSISPVPQVSSVMPQPSTSRDESSPKAADISPPVVKKPTRNFLQVADFLPYKKRKKDIIPEPVRRKQAEKLAGMTDLEKCKK